MADKTIVKVSTTPVVKVSDDTTIVKKIVTGTPVKSITAQPFDARTLGGESGGYYLNYNNFTNTPTIIDSAVVKQLSVDSAEVLAIIDSDYLDRVGIQNFVDSADGGRVIGQLDVTDHIIPTRHQEIDLGSPTAKFRALYLAGQTLFVGELALSDNGSGGITIAPVDSSGKIDSSVTPGLVATDIDSGVVTAIIDSAYINFRINAVDSGRTIDVVTPLIDSAVADLIDAAPEQLNTLNELAAALNDDSDAFNTLTNLVNTKVDSDNVVNLIDSAYVQARVAGGGIGTPTDTVYTDGFVSGFVPSTTIADAIDELNEALLNLAKDNFVQSVSFTGSPLAGGEGTAVTLTISAVGNPNRYDVYWGDGTIDSAITDNTPTHTYTDNSGSPYTVRVRAFNNTAVGIGSDANQTRDDYVIIYTADPVMAFALYRDASGGNALSGNNLYVIEGNSLHLQNNTTNTTMADVSYTVNWGDGSTNDTVDSDSASGGVLGGRLSHTWADGTTSGTGLDTVTLTLDSHSTADPSIIPRNTTLNLKVYDPDIAAPNLLGTKTISLGFSSSGTSPKLVSGFTDNVSGGTSLNAGDTVTRTTSSSTLSTNTTSTFAYNADSGTLSALINGSTDGSISLTGADNTGSNGAIQVTEERDYNLLDATGYPVAFNNSIYHPDLYTGYKAKINKAPSVGANSWQMDHSGSTTNTLEFVRDDVTSSPSISAAGSLAQNVAGNFRYISGIPYYNSGSPSLTLSGATISNLTGQTYTNQSNIVEVLSGINYESTSTPAISRQSYTYANIDGTSTMLSGGIPTANVGVSSAYAIGDLTVPITTSSVRTIEALSIRARNTNGVGTASNLTEKIQVHTASQSGISEIAIAVADALGGTYDDDGVRIFDFNGDSADNPSFVGSTNFYTNNTYSEASDPGVSGTKEATIRLGNIKYDVTDYSTGFLPAGPDRSGDTGTQYFTFAFRRRVVSNFDINITSSGIAGLWIAAPGTAIDDASTINGWLDASVVYNGSGVPGADTGNGGNGSNGCASTGGDVIASSTSLSGSYTMTLGTENLTNATGNVALVRIALTSGQSVTSLSIS